MATWAAVMKNTVSGLLAAVRDIKYAWELYVEHLYAGKEAASYANSLDWIILSMSDWDEALLDPSTLSEMSQDDKTRFEQCQEALVMAIEELRTLIDESKQKLDQKNKASAEGLFHGLIWTFDESNRAKILLDQIERQVRQAHMFYKTKLYKM